MSKTLFETVPTSTEAPPSPYCIGEFARENVRARILRAEDSCGIPEVWIELSLWRGNAGWLKLGFIRAKELAMQVDALSRATEYLSKFPVVR